MTKMKPVKAWALVFKGLSVVHPEVFPTRGAARAARSQRLYRDDWRIARVEIREIKS